MMKRGIYNLFCGLIFINASAVLADDQRFELSLRGYPKTKPKCEDTAREVGSQFEQQTSAKVLIARCLNVEESKSTVSYNIELIYAADKEFNIVPSSLWPVHNSLEKCVQSLPNEKADFESVTGLKSILQYCSLRAVRYSQPVVPYPKPYTEAPTDYISIYSTVFYGVGLPKSVQKSFHLDYSHAVIGNATKIGQEIFEKSKASGLPVKAVFVDAQRQATIWLNFVLPANKAGIELERYYLWKKTIEYNWFYNYNDGQPERMQTNSQCLEQLELAKAMFASKFSSPVIWVCTRDTAYNRFHLGHLRIKPGGESFWRYVPGEKGEPFLNEYPSREKCEEDKPRVLAYYKEQLQESIVGALCSFPVVKIPYHPGFTASIDPRFPIKMYVYSVRNK